MILCASCGAESPSGQRFCGQCGALLTRSCPACGTENPPENRFCGNCGTALADGLAAPVGTAAVGVSERRLVSVLFADLVGFTTLSEHLDPEEVRELPPARATALLRAIRLRLTAEQARRGGDVARANADADEACAILEDVGARPLLARTLLERARSEQDLAALAQSRDIYAQLGATRWLERIKDEFKITA